MSLINPYLDNVTASGAIAGAGAVAYQRGCVLTRNAAGVYFVDLDQPMGTTEGVVMVTCRTADRAAHVTHTTATRKTITTRTIAAAPGNSNCDIDVKVIRVSGGAGR
jgi:hypothetical protein